jgi:hypothetical protein
MAVVMGAPMGRIALVRSVDWRPRYRPCVKRLMQGVARREDQQTGNQSSEDSRHHPVNRVTRHRTAGSAVLQSHCN